MAPKSLVVLAALLIAVVVSAGQLPRGAGLEAASTNTNSSVIVSGKVPCATGNSINIASARRSPLVCGSNVVGSTTTESTGEFLLSQSSVSKNLVAAVMGNLCKVVMATPLGACDQSLAGATGTLSAPLKLLGITTDSGSDLLGFGSTLIVGPIVRVLGQIVGVLIGGILYLGTTSFSFV